MFYRHRPTVSDIFPSGKPADAKKVAHNTYRYTRDGVTCYRLHRTDVVRVLPCGSVMLDSGGWETVTTKERMNRYIPAPYYISQRKHKWYVHNSRTGEVLPYEDGMVLPPMGS